MGAVMATKAIPNWKHGGDWYGRLNWTEDELDCRLREFYGGMFERYARAQGKSRWGEKTPFHTSHMATMASVFPDALFVGIVRHPGGVAASLGRTSTTRSRTRFPTGPRPTWTWCAPRPISDPASSPAVTRISCRAGRRCSAS